MKYLKLNELLKKIKQLKKKGKKIVFTNGCFDIIHSGHIKILRESKKFGDILIVGLNSDDSIRKIKGKDRPVNKLKDRIDVLSAIEYVDYIVVFSQKTPYNLIKKIKPDVLVKGGDYTPDKVVGREYAGRVVIVPLLKGRSTTKIIEKISNK